MPEISVIICSHNPREDYLRRTLAALKAQTLPREQWELLLVDNASEKSLANRFDLSWHPKARHIREEKVGLTHALLVTGKSRVERRIRLAMERGASRASRDLNRLDYSRPSPVD